MSGRIGTGHEPRSRVPVNWEFSKGPSGVSTQAGQLECLPHVHRPRLSGVKCCNLLAYCHTVHTLAMLNAHSTACLDERPALPLWALALLELTIQQVDDSYPPSHTRIWEPDKLQVYI
eukprot:Gb_11348 [translate_table: standard]